LTISLVQKKEYESLLSISIEDSEIDITQEKNLYISTPLLQMEPSTTRRFHGTGLGLITSNQLINLMKGSIEVSSAEGKIISFNFAIYLVTSEFNTDKVTQSEATKNEAILTQKIMK
jgi:signal transduction histidine kinase